MPVPRVAVESFLHRRLRDYRVCLSWSEAMIDAHARRLPVLPPIYYRLRRHQKACFVVGANARRFYFANDTGTGKTVLSVALARYLEASGSARRCLVLVPREANKFEWEAEVRKHAPDVRCAVLDGSNRRKWEQLTENEDALITVGTYMGIVSMVSALERRRKRRGGGEVEEVNKLVPQERLVHALCASFEAVFCDESHHLGNKSSLPFRVVRQLSRRAAHFYCLTGTPFGRDPEALWSQFYLVDGGDTLGPTLGLFRAAFFDAHVNKWGDTTYTISARRRTLLHRTLAHRSLRVEIDAADLPRVTEITRYVKLPDETYEYYERASSAIADSLSTGVHALRNAFCRLRQISSGFVGYTTDEGARAELEFPRNPKLDLCMSIVESIAAAHKVIIFHEFHHSGGRLTASLDRLGIPSVMISGLTRDPGGARRAFLEDPAVRVCLLSNSMVEGLNLQVARYGIFYELPVPYITYYQARRRVERQYSEHEHVFLYYLLTRGTSDGRVRALHRQGRDIFEAVVRGEVSARWALGAE